MFTLVELFLWFGVIIQMLVHEDIPILINIVQHFGIKEPLIVVNAFQFCHQCCRIHGRIMTSQLEVSL